MTNEQMIQVAKNYIAMHKNHNAEDWFLQCQSGTDDKKYLEIYAKLEGGVFGECRDNAEYDDEGEIVSAATEYEIEIRGSETKSGNPYIFEWEA